MKFTFFIILSFLIILIEIHANISTNSNENDLLYTSEYVAYLEKECERLNNENMFICTKFKNRKTKNEDKSKTRVMSRVEATVYNNTTASITNHDLFNFALPINTCKNEDCKFCCLSTNRCGTKKQCENSKYYIKYIHYIFFILCVILIMILLIKCYQTDSYPDQISNEKIDNSDLSELISMFSIIRNNRKKLIT